MSQSSSPDWTSIDFCLYDPERAEWVRLFDGFTLGRKRDGEIHAVDLEKSSHHCVFQLGQDGVLKLVDLSGLGVTTLNGKRVPFGGETALRENDHLRVNRRDYYVTRGQVRPVPQPELEPAPPPAPPAPPASALTPPPLPVERSAAPSAPAPFPAPPPLPAAEPGNPARAPQPRARPVAEVRGASLQPRPHPGRRLGALVVLLLSAIRAVWAAAARFCAELAARLRPYAESLLLSALLLALIAFAANRHFAGHTEVVEPATPALVASNGELPRTPLESKPASLPTPKLEKRESLPDHPLQLSDVKLPRREPPHALPDAAFRSAPLPPERKGILSGSARPQPASPSKPSFEILYASDAAPPAPAPAPPETESAPNPQQAGTETGHPRITAISVLNSDTRQTNFTAQVPAQRVVAALEDLNRGPARDPAASGATERFEQPSVTRGGVSYRLDWCYRWEQSCGKEAADAFCREMGLPGADSFEVARTVGNASSPTAIIGQDGVYCPGSDPGHPCDGFSYIECAKR